MERAKRYRSSNFSKHEIDVLRQILTQYTIIENKSKTMQVEWGKKEAWKNITENFNAHENVLQRDVNQLKNAWKKMKAMAKSELNEMIKQRIANNDCVRVRSAEEQNPKVDTEQTSIAIKPEPLLTEETPNLVPLPVHGIVDNNHAYSAASDGENESQESSRHDTEIALPQARKRHAAEIEDRRTEMMEEEHRARMQILEAELANKLLEREHRMKEHEATLRNLDVVFERLRNGDINSIR